MKFFIPGEFVTLNNYIREERAHLQHGARLKKMATNAVFFECRNLPKVESYPVVISFHWICKDKRTDPDNVRFQAKFILDGLVKAGVLRNDTWKEIAAFGGDTFEVDPNNPGVEVTIITKKK